MSLLQRTGIYLVILYKTSVIVTYSYFSPILTHSNGHNGLISIYTSIRIYEDNCLMYECVCNGE
jgi:hypothetical protein